MHDNSAISLQSRIKSSPSFPITSWTEVKRSLLTISSCVFQRSDYINASFMDGYKQRRAYIGTQGKTIHPHLHITST